MTKKEMAYEIISHTRLSGVNESGVNYIITKAKKSELEKIYNAFVKDKEHALYYYWLIAGKCM